MRFITLSNQLSHRLQQRLLNEIQGSPYDSTQFDTITEQASNIVEDCLPRSLTDRIKAVMHGDLGYLGIEGIPQDPQLMDTPSQDGVVEREKRTFVKEYFSMAIAHMLGLEIFNYAQEGWGQGKLIFNVFPMQRFLGIKGAGGTEPDFRFHTENAWHPTSIRSVMLVGMRPDHDGVAETYAAGAVDIVAQLERDDLLRLSQERFIIDPPEIHRRMEQEKGIPFTADESFRGPILTWTETGLPELRLNFNGMRAESDNPQNEAALTRLEAVAKRCAAVVKLNESNMVIINNFRAIHTRNGYQPRFDGKDRWFQRYFLTDAKTLWKNKPIRPEDFALGTNAYQAVMTALRAQNLVDRSGCLTEQFTPHREGFSLELPDALKEQKLQILKGLIRQGPSPKNRVV